MDFKERVFAMYKERIANGAYPEAASMFSSSDFRGMDLDEFLTDRSALDACGYIKK